MKNLKSLPPPAICKPTFTLKGLFKLFLFIALLNSSHLLFAQPGAFPNNVIKPGCEGNSLRQYVVSTYNPNTGLVTYITRITITCPRCAQWHNPAPLYGGYYYSCDSAAGLWQAKPGLCPPCVDITFDELLQHYIVS